MNDTDEFLKDYILWGPDTGGLTDTDQEIYKNYFADDEMATPMSAEYEAPPNSYRRTTDVKSEAKPRGIEEARWKTKEEKRDCIIYAMRDSMKMSTKEFASLYNPTGLGSNGRKGGVIHVLDEGIFTEFGETDVDWAVTLVDFSPTLKILGRTVYETPSQLVYPVGKATWNVFGKKKWPWDQYCNPAEVHAMMMANSMIFGFRKFHEFFPQYSDEAMDPKYETFYMMVLETQYGNNRNN